MKHRTTQLNDKNGNINLNIPYIEIKLGADDKKKYIEIHNSAYTFCWMRCLSDFNKSSPKVQITLKYKTTIKSDKGEWETGPDRLKDIVWERVDNVELKKINNNDTLLKLKNIKFTIPYSIYSEFNSPNAFNQDKTFFNHIFL